MTGVSGSGSVGGDRYRRPMTDTPIVAAEQVTAEGTASRMAAVMHRTATVNGEVLFERRYDDTDVVYRSLTMTAGHHEALGSPDRLTVTVEPGDRLNEPAPEGETHEQQIDRLATFIMRHVPGEPSQSEGAVDTAIRLLSATVATETGGITT
jgi:hypothetical protein